MQLIIGEAWQERRHLSIKASHQLTAPAALMAPPFAGSFVTLPLFGMHTALSFLGCVYRKFAFDHKQRVCVYLLFKCKHAYLGSENEGETVQANS